jgi:hypothetical protein
MLEFSFSLSFFIIFFYLEFELGGMFVQAETGHRQSINSRIRDCSREALRTDAGI